MTAYRICDVWKGSRRSTPTYPTLGAMSKMGLVDRMTVSKSETDAAIFADLDPALRSRVFEAALNAANGIKTPEDKLLEQQIERMLDNGQLEPNVAAALLRMCNGQIGEKPDLTGAQARDVPGADRGHDPGARDDLDPTRPATGKAAGSFADSLRGYMASRRAAGLVVGRWR